MNDDPREVLALLNSLGFVGITAQQLKDFMKDLKLYRKMKDRERQQRKEEIKRKIMDKQKSMIKEILREQTKEFHSVESTISSNTSSSCVDSSIVKVKVKCLSSDKENRNAVKPEENYINHVSQKLDMTHLTCKSRRTQDHYSAKSSSVSYDYATKKSHLKSEDGYECLKKDSQRTIEKQSRTKREHEKELEQSVRPMSAPNILEHRQHVSNSQITKSISSTKHTSSGSKSFIRPWRLQPEAQKTLSTKKSDPVTLYQKYQQEWKQMSFPGEAKHSSIRWAIREKMLGVDPHPMPLPKKSVSLPTLKRK